VASEAILAVEEVHGRWSKWPMCRCMLQYSLSMRPAPAETYLGLHRH